MPYVLQERRPDLDKIVYALTGLDLQNSDDLVEFLGKLADANLTISRAVFVNRRLDQALKLADELQVKPNGDINYILFKLCKYFIKPSYSNYKNFIGDIEAAMRFSIRRSYQDEYREAAEWIRIKLLTPYEEKKCIDNGDI